MICERLSPRYQRRLRIRPYRRADSGVKDWITAAPRGTLYISVLTLAELRRGIELRELGKRRTQLEQWLRDELLPSFDEENILPVTKSIGDRWAIFSARAEQRGTPLPIFDGLLAATAFEHDLTIATRNTRHFVDLGVPILNPWQT